MSVSQTSEGIQVASEFEAQPLTAVSMSALRVLLNTYRGRYSVSPTSGDGINAQALGSVDVDQELQIGPKKTVRPDQHNDDEIYVTSITHDSRKVVPGSLYIALAGRITHGARFIPAAIEQGAVAIALPMDTPSDLLAWFRPPSSVTKAD